MSMTVMDGSRSWTLEVIPGETILEALKRCGIRGVHAPCGGKGSCGKCGVYIRSDSFCGVRLSCTEKAEDGMTVELSPVVRVSFSGEEELPHAAADPGQEGYAAACDLGTTTLVCRLYRLDTGESIASVSGSNQQSLYGANVLSRLQAAAEGQAKRLSELLRQQLNDFLKSLCSSGGIGTASLKFIAVSGNTLMEHFLAGLCPTEDGKPVFKERSHFGNTVPAREAGLDFDAEVFFCPSVSPLLGGDVTAGLYAAGAAEAEKPVLYCDLGTNSELVLGCGDKFAACTADGGALVKASLLDKGMTASEGAVSEVDFKDGRPVLKVLGGVRPSGICGSGMISALGAMYRTGLMDEMGHIADAEDLPDSMAWMIGREQGERVLYLTENRKVYITQGDISRFQLAKAAVSAGIRVLCHELGIRESEIGRVCLAGGFGSFSAPSHAAAIGLIPAELLAKAESLGNASLSGAVSAALNREARESMCKLSRSIRAVELPTHPVFGDAYVEGMLFEL